jgi:adenine-specific DNA-methyltransferase
MDIVEARDEVKVKIPHVIKYMGSKKKILTNVLDALLELHKKEVICDLFAGSSVLSGALRGQSNVWSNDIQEYSAVLSSLYLSNYDWKKHPHLASDILKTATEYVCSFQKAYPKVKFSYGGIKTVSKFKAIEKAQQDLMDMDFSKMSHHLFVKFYSGTYWSFEQCLWIDAIKFASEKYKATSLYFPIISSLMFAMSYNSQSTGHYAQYRDAYDLTSMADIMIYRNKEIWPLFEKKLKEFTTAYNTVNKFSFKATTLDYLECLDALPRNSLVYADPPYCFVHYSRFYHAIETLVKYDYPEVQFKGRYRTDRHQSPFCIRTKVKDSFHDMFVKIREKNSQLVLSYSNTGMIGLDELIALAKIVFGKEYKITVEYIDYLHSTMGRKNDKSREVQESLIMATRK